MKNTKNKIIRTICIFTDNPTEDNFNKLNKIADRLIENNFSIQTKRMCSSSFERMFELDFKETEEKLFCLGSLHTENLLSKLDNLLATKNIYFNLDLTTKEILISDVKILFNIIEKNPNKTFNFTYVFNNHKSSPFFPSSVYDQNGFSIGLQPTDLSENCGSVEEWLNKTKDTWVEIYDLFKMDKNFLGIDSSIAPFLNHNSSLINFIKRLGFSFSESTTTDIYLKITKFIKQQNPMPVGLCGLMLPCLEDFELANEYEMGNFSLERNIYLSLNSGLGIDTYPIGIDENPKRVLQILTLIQGLSNKYKKPLSVRFVSDGKAKIGEKTDFKNQYLKDVIIRKI